ncbi:MAG: aminopeptidase P family protein [Pseudomonadota bacterium]
MFQTFDAKAERRYAADHLPLIRKAMAAQNLDGFIIPNDDEYQNEYTPAYAQRLTWATGFTGSAGAAIVLQEKAAIFTDGRYTLQVRQQTDDQYYAYESVPETSTAQWLKEHSEPGAKIGYDPMLHAKASLQRLQKAADARGFHLVAVEKNPVDAAWSDQPARPDAPVTVHPIKYAGVASATKRAQLAEKLKADKIDAALITAPPSVAWLFNIRGGDVERTPLPLSRALLFNNGNASLFVDGSKVTDAVRTHLGTDVSIDDENALPARLKELGAAKKTVAIDPALTPAGFITLLTESGANVIDAPDPCELPRAIKNAVEIDGTRAAHQRDGVAVTRFLHWLDTVAQDGSIDEIKAAKQLEAFRAKTGALTDLSFDTISGAGPNGAIVHYRVTTETNRPLNLGDLYLVDSGAQYQDGTTDITRVAAIGKPSAEMRDRYTRVLKGHIALATALFPKGVCGDQLDALARAPLWDIGLDYDHGTGHGVGSFLGVHEGPQRVAKSGNGVTLEPGMILSNEPGYYKTDAYGIRIENLLVVQPAERLGRAPEGAEREMYGFETITLAPYARALIEPSLLTQDEKQWVDDYHARVRETLAPDAPADLIDWLEAATAPL